MSLTTDTTTLICLFHHDDHAKAALEDLEEAGIPQSSITTLRTGDSHLDSQGISGSHLASLGLPARDLEHLQSGIEDGGTIIIVAALTDHVSTVERIFGDHRAEKIDELDTKDEVVPYAAAAITLAAAGETTIPIVEEELAVGKRTVDQGGVRVYRRVIEIPVEQSVSLREEHVVIERTAVDRPATQSDLAAQGHSIQLIETAEEAVVSKNARVVEEVLIGKQIGERTETIRDTVRRTEVEFEELPSTDTNRVR